MPDKVYSLKQVEDMYNKLKSHIQWNEKEKKFGFGRKNDPNYIAIDFELFKQYLAGHNISIEENNG